MAKQSEQAAFQQGLKELESRFADEATLLEKKASGTESEITKLQARLEAELQAAEKAKSGHSDQYLSKRDELLRKHITTNEVAANILITSFPSAQYLGMKVEDVSDKVEEARLMDIADDDGRSMIKASSGAPSVTKQGQLVDFLNAKNAEGDNKIELIITADEIGERLKQRAEKGDAESRPISLAPVDGTDKVVVTIDFSKMDDKQFINYLLPIAADQIKHDKATREKTLAGISVGLGIDPKQLGLEAPASDGKSR